jgi:hypothetical protein
VSDGQIVCAAGATVKPLVHLQSALRRRNGKPKPPLEAVLPAVAAAVALALPADAVATGIETFDANGTAFARGNGRALKAAAS